MVYGIQKEGRKGCRVLHNSLTNRIAIVWAMFQGGAMTGWLTSARQLWSERISCKGQVELGLGLYKILFYFEAFVREVTILSFPAPTLVQNYCTTTGQYTTPPPTSCHTPYNIGNNNIV